MANVDATELVGVVGALPTGTAHRDLRGNAAVYGLGLTGDITAPVVDTFSPADAGSLSKTTSVSFEVRDSSALSLVVVFLTLGSGALEMIYDGADFIGGYGATSSTSVISGGLSFDIGPAPYWLDADLEFTIVAIDVLGNKSTTTYTLTVTDPPVVDAAAPVVSNPYPALGTKLVAESFVGADVTDDGPFRRIMLVIEYDGHPDEVAYDGSVFRPWYVASSTVTSISGGYQFRVKRFGGWPAAPRLVVYPIDQAGREG